MKINYHALVVGLCLGTIAGNLSTSADEPKPTIEPYVPPIALGRATTYIDGPLAADGSIDFVAGLNEITSRGIAPEKNAIVAMVEVLGPKTLAHCWSAPGEREQFFRALGRPLPPEEGDYYVDSLEYADRLGPPVKPPEMESERRKRFFDAEIDSPNRPWKPADSPELSAWIDANEGALKRLAAAVRMPKAFIPVVGNPNGWFLSLAMLSPMRSLSRVLHLRALRSLGTGDTAAACEDILSMYHIARLCSQGPTQVDLLVAQALAGMAEHADFQLARYGNLSAAELTAHRLEIERFPRFPPLAEKTDVGERLFYLAGLQTYWRGDGVPEIIERLEFRPLMEFAAIFPRAVDWEESLRMTNHWNDRVVTALKKPTWQEQRAALAEVVPSFRRQCDEELHDPFAWIAAALDGDGFRKFVGRQIAYGLILGEFGGGEVTMLEAMLRYDARREMTRLHLAIAAYRADHKQFPAKLTDLAPKYLPQVPSDLFSGKSFIYKPNERDYQLYSVGPDGVDDGGENPDDIIFEEE